MKPEEIVRYQARYYHRLDMSEQRARAVANNMRAIAGAFGSSARRLDFDRSPADYVCILRSGQDTETDR